MALANLRVSSKGVTFLIILAVVIFFGCVLAYVGAAGKLRAVAQELQSKQKQVRDSEKVVERLETSRLRYLDTQAQLRYLETSVSTRNYVPTLLRQLEHLGKSVSLKVLAVRPEPKKADTMVVRKLSSASNASEGNVEQASEETAALKKKHAAKLDKPYDELKIDLELEGKYMNALDFLYRLTSFPKIVAVNFVQMTPICSSGMPLSCPNLTIKMNITAFVFRDPKPGAAPDGEAPRPSAAVVGGNEEERT